MTIAQTDRPDSDSFSLSASPQPDGSRLGTTTGTGWYAVPGVFEHSYTDVSATVTITSFPNPVPSDLRDAGDDLVVGSFAIDASGFSVTGTFSTPICAFNLCV